MRQLSRRNPRRRGRARHSMASDANILRHDSDQKSVQLNGGRSRSMSGSSAILLNRHQGVDPRTSMGLDSISANGARHNRAESGSAPYTPTISGGASAFSYLPGGSQAAGQGGSVGARAVNLKKADAADPWYRPPRARRPTNEALHSRARSQGSWTSADWANKRWSEHSPRQDGSPIPREHLVESLTASGRATPLPAHLGTFRDRSDSNIDDTRRSKTDYAIREGDFYYGVRGRALSTLPTRRLKTGPADPTGPVSSATGWFKGFFGGKIKDKGKGFEVVRSSRAPPMDRATSGVVLSDADVPYSDEPGPKRTRDLELSDDGDAIGGGTRHLPGDIASSSSISEVDDGERSFADEEYISVNRANQVSQFPPSLPTIETGDGIELPSRLGSKASSPPTRHATHKSGNVSRGNGSDFHGRLQHHDLNFDQGLMFSKGAASLSSGPNHSSKLHDADNLPSARVRPSGSISQRLPFESQTPSSQNTRPSTAAESTGSSIPPQNGSSHNSGGYAKRPMSALGSLAPDLRQDRPSSMGYVQQHRAGENFHSANPDQPALIGSRAELVYDFSQSSSTSSDNRFGRRL